MSKQNNKNNTTPNNGRNRQERREQARRPQQHRSDKPLWLRIVIVAVIAAMILGFFLVPLLR
ncbi:MAG: hypothetical protein J5722_02140 [Oscillospiraceae bacterium]|nr:hypothetical protein [Oscillospiraceae bacterium]